MESKDMNTVEHVKGSDITGSWARNLDIKPDCRYKVSIKLDQAPPPSRDDLMKAIEQAQGIWKDRIHIVEEMAETRQSADRY